MALRSPVECVNEALNCEFQSGIRHAPAHSYCSRLTRNWARRKGSLSEDRHSKRAESALTRLLIQWLSRLIGLHRLRLHESDIGKELVARAIHDLSARKDHPLVRVNCAFIPKELFESEFFGHVRGAFTGAIKDRVGRFELADGGTLLRDEIGEIPPDLQSKLLRVLQEGQFERLGDDRTRTVQARLIAAANRDLLREAKAGRFRLDLYLSAQRLSHRSASAA